MLDKPIIIYTVLTILMLIVHRMRNQHQSNRVITINNKIIRFFSIPVTIYGKSTITGIIGCISYEFMLIISYLLLFIVRIDNRFVCYFWGVLIVFVLFFGETCQLIWELKKEEEFKNKLSLLFAACLFGVVSFGFLVNYIYLYVK